MRCAAARPPHKRPLMILWRYSAIGRSRDATKCSKTFGHSSPTCVNLGLSKGTVPDWLSSDQLVKRGGIPPADLLLILVRQVLEVLLDCLLRLRPCAVGVRIVAG